MPISFSAPGKLMLLGEHAVLYGHPCLVTAVDLRVTVHASPRSDDLLVIETPGMRERGRTFRMSMVEFSKLKEYPAETGFVLAALQQICRQVGGCQPLTIATAGPLQSYGLGSSSAVTAAAVAAIAQLHGLELSKKQVFQAAYASVLAVQGKGSGFDVASAVYGGTLLYQSGGEVIEPLPVKDLPVIIGYSGRKISTSRLIDQVACLHDRHAPLVESIFSLIGGLVDRARQPLLACDWRVYGELMNIHQGLLESLGVSTPKLERAIHAARRAGACGAKLSGAGGGDCMYAVVQPGSERAVQQAIRASGSRVIECKVNVEGLRRE